MELFAFFGVIHSSNPHSMGAFFSSIIYRPILNLTIALYGILPVHDLGLTIICITLLIRIVLLPLSLRASRSQKAMAELAPELETIKAQHKGNTTAQSEAMMRLYKERGVHPLSGCLPLIIQLPILIGVYQVFQGIFHPDSLGKLYSFVANPGTVSHIFLGIVDISEPSIVLALAAGVLQFFQARLASAGQTPSGQAAAMQKQMMYILPVMIVVISWNLPAGIALYWVVTTICSIVEQLYIRRPQVAIERSR